MDEEDFNIRIMFDPVNVQANRQVARQVIGDLQDIRRNVAAVDQQTRNLDRTLRSLGRRRVSVNINSQQIQQAQQQLNNVLQTAGRGGRGAPRAPGVSPVAAGQPTPILGGSSTQAIGGQRSLAQVNGRVTRSFDGVIGRALRTTAVYGGLFTAITAGRRSISGIINDFRSLEVATVDVQRIAGLTGQETERLQRNFRNLSLEIPVTTQELLELSGVAARLGVENAQDLEAFATAFTRVQASTNIRGELGAEQFTRFIQLTDFGIENADRFGNAVVNLGRRFNTTETQLLRTGLRLTQETEQFNFSAQQLLGAATALSAAGLAPERSAGALQRILLGLQRTAGGSRQQLELLLSTLRPLSDGSRVTAESFAELARSAPLDALRLLLQQTVSSEATLRALGRTGSREVGVFATLAQNVGLLESAFAESNSSIRSNQDLIALADQRYNTFDGTIGRVNNQLSEFGRILVDDGGLLQSFASGIEGLIFQLTGLGSEASRVQRILNSPEFRGESFFGREVFRVVLALVVPGGGLTADAIVGQRLPSEEVREVRGRIDALPGRVDAFRNLRSALSGEVRRLLSQGQDARDIQNQLSGRFQQLEGLRRSLTQEFTLLGRGIPASIRDVISNELRQGGGRVRLPIAQAEAAGLTVADAQRATGSIITTLEEVLGTQGRRTSQALRDLERSAAAVVGVQQDLVRIGRQNAAAERRGVDRDLFLNERAYKR